MENKLKLREPNLNDFADRLRAKFGINAGAPVDSQCLLLDTSGSMDERCGHKTKLRLLWDITEKFPRVRQFVFASDCIEIPSGSKKRTEGGTSMHLAFNTVKAAGIKHAILITDGIPDSAPAAKAASKGLKIDIFYVGPDPVPIFLKELAQDTGGTFEPASLDLGAKTLETKIRALISAPR